MAKNVYGNYDGENVKSHQSGRYPSQLFVDENAAKNLDEQSGVLKSGNVKPYKRLTNNQYSGGFPDNTSEHGGCSRILHTCKYETEEIDLCMYEKKVSKKERQAGVVDSNESSNTNNRRCLTCNRWERKQQHSDKYTCHCEEPNWEQPKGNLHPTLKPISLIYRIFRLFKLPKECNQKIYIPFAGVFSEVIGAYKAGIKEENIYVCEISKEYIEIGKKRFKYWKDRRLKVEETEKEKKGRKEHESPFF